MQPLDPMVYLDNPDLASYFSSLSPVIQKKLLDSGVEISTLGELKECAEHFTHS